MTAIDAGAQPLSLPVEKLDDVVAAVDMHRLDCGGKRVGLGTVRRRQQEDALAVVLQAAELHELPAAGQSRNREAIAHALAEGREVGEIP